jgi:hypothetical protein
MIRFVKNMLAAIAGLILLLGLWLIAGVWWPLPLAQPNEQVPSLLLTDVSIVNVESGRVLQHQDILVESGQITTVGTALDVPEAGQCGRGSYGKS